MQYALQSLNTLSYLRIKGPHIERETVYQSGQWGEKEHLKRRRGIVLTFNLHKYSPQQAIITIYSQGNNHCHLTQPQSAVLYRLTCPQLSTSEDP